VVSLGLGADYAIRYAKGREEGKPAQS
jgi:hypothetical protein